MVTAAGPRPIHMVGIGGAGMSALARLALGAGYTVSGTDRDASSTLDALRALGAEVSVGHRADALPAAAAALVVSTAVPDENPERAAARARGIPEMHRAEFLAELMSTRRGLAVAGAHGKSTTSAMLALALGDASACIGAEIPGGEGTGAMWGSGPWFVAEADESDRSLLRLAPEAAILTNVDHDHHATFATIGEVEQVFRRFVAGLPDGGLLVVGPDDRARECAGAARCPVRTVGWGPGADLWIEGAGADARVVTRDGRAFPLALRVPGRHNLANAACALALAEWCGVDLGLGASRLAPFDGVGRRFQLRGEAAGVRVVDDYAHHPAEIAATLAAARELAPARVVAVFQPHLFSRTQALAAEIGQALGAADVVVVTEIYGARESPLPGVSGRDVARAVPPPARTTFAPTLGEAADAVMREVRPGDLVLTLGAGDVTTLGQDLTVLLENVQRRARANEQPGGSTR